jgi:hypothetical protein
MTEPGGRFEALVERVRKRPDGVLGILRVVGYRGEDGFHARVGVVVEMCDGRIATVTARNVGDVEKALEDPAG